MLLMFTRFFVPRRQITLKSLIVASVWIYPTIFFYAILQKDKQSRFHLYLRSAVCHLCYSFRFICSWNYWQWWSWMSQLQVGPHGETKAYMVAVARRKWLSVPTSSPSKIELSLCHIMTPIGNIVFIRVQCCALYLFCVSICCLYCALFHHISN